MSPAQPQMHYFVTNRNITVATTAGAAIAFEKGKPTHVPKFMHESVQEKGALPCDKDGKVTEASDAPEEPTAAAGSGLLLAPEDAESRNEAIEKTIRAIVERNAAPDFTAGGMPSAGAVSLALGWRVDQKEVRPIWVKIRPELLTAGKAE